MKMTKKTFSGIKLAFLSIFWIFNNSFSKIGDLKYFDVEKYSLVFVYTGESLPAYVTKTVGQARLFNRDCNIFFIASRVACERHSSVVDRLHENCVNIVACEDLEPSVAHNVFNNNWRKNWPDRVLYWKYTVERFFYIDELMRQLNLRDVFQVECDVLLYVDLQKYLGILHTHYPGIACPFDNDYVASVSFVYFAHEKALAHLLHFINDEQVGKVFCTDMHLFAAYKNANSDAEIDHLPTICKEYIRHMILRSMRGDVSSRPWKYWNHMSEWDSLFDNDYISEFLRQGKWVATQNLFDPSVYQFQWGSDEEGRKVLYAFSPPPQFDKKYRVNTLHISSKNFENFLSI